MIILGVDPGTWHTGIGLIEASGNKYALKHMEVVSPKKSLNLQQRLSVIHRRLVDVIHEYIPDVVALENVFYGKDLKAMVKIGEARACAMLAASEGNLEVFEYPPARVKQAVSGNGRATKEQIQYMVQRLLNLKELPPSDGADALAIAICHLHSHQSVKGDLMAELKKKNPRKKTVSIK